MTPASEEHRDADVTFEVVGRLFLAKEIDIKQVVAEVEAQGDRVVQQEAVSQGPRLLRELDRLLDVEIVLRG